MCYTHELSRAGTLAFHLCNQDNTPIQKVGLETITGKPLEITRCCSGEVKTVASATRRSIKLRIPNPEFLLRPAYRYISQAMTHPVANSLIGLYYLQHRRYDRVAQDKQRVRKLLMMQELSIACLGIPSDFYFPPLDGARRWRLRIRLEHSWGVQAIRIREVLAREGTSCFSPPAANCVLPWYVAHEGRQAH